MRSKLIIVATVVASLLFVPLMASADEVQEQLRLMEQRMAEMEDRLQATSVELETAKATVDQQQGLLSEAGLMDAEDLGVRSGVGQIWDMIDVTGAVVVSYNQRLKDSDTDTDGGTGLERDQPSTGDGGNVGLPYHANSNTFQVDRVQLNVSKTPTEESRGGFEFEYLAGATAWALTSSTSTQSGDTLPYLYSANVAYLMPCLGGVEVRGGLMGTVFGAEVVQTNQNYFVTQGNLFALQPVTYAGVSFTGNVTDELSWGFGIVNDVYSPTFKEESNDKAYWGQASFNTDMFGVSLGAIGGSDSGCGGADCTATVIDLLVTADPADNVSLWMNFDYQILDGDDRTNDGDAWGISAAGRVGVTDSTGVATRVEYVMKESEQTGGSDDEEIVSVTGTVDHALTDYMTVRGEVRYDVSLEDQSFQYPGGNDDQVVAILEAFFEF